MSDARPATDLPAPDFTRGAGAAPAPQVLVSNDDDDERSVDVVVGRREGLRAREVTIGPGATVAVALPSGDGPATVEVHSEGVAASTTFTPGTSVVPPLFTVRRGRVLIAGPP